MPTRNVVVTDRQAEMIDRLVSEGRYQNASEVLRDGLRLVEQRDAAQAARLESLREALATGAADIERGDFVELRGPAEIKQYIDRLFSEATERASRT